MGIDNRLTQKLKQTQRLTPMQVRYVKILEMPAQVFEAEVRNAIDEMPALEATQPDEVKSQGEITNETEDGGRFNETAQEVQIADYKSQDDIPDYLRNKINGGSQASPEDYYESPIVAGEDSMVDYLMEQLSELDITEDERLIAKYIIGNLDENGYLTIGLQTIADDIAYAEDREFSPETMRNAWNKVRQLDPPGIGAADLRDCLILQLKRLPKSIETLTALEIIRDYFDMFSKKHFSKIASSLGIDEERMRRANVIIAKLNPKPASLLESTGGGAAKAIVPDFLVEVDQEGNMTLSLLNKIPELSIEKTFAADAPLPEASERMMSEARVFLKQKREEAADFIKIVSMRQKTLFTVMSAILKFQRQFFLTEDESQIRPMVLRELADVTGLDLSVVSRATQDKYVMTNTRMYPLRMFFNERRKKDASPEGDDNNNTIPQITAAIKRIIEQEDKKKPLSDEQITKQLTADGFDIARRTVAKYRERLGFPVGRLRRNL